MSLLFAIAVWYGFGVAVVGGSDQFVSAFLDSGMFTVGAIVFQAMWGIAELGIIRGTYLHHGKIDQLKRVYHKEMLSWWVWLLMPGRWIVLLVCRRWINSMNDGVQEALAGE